MQKTELLQLHALLFRVRRHLERRDVVDDDAFAAYDALGVRPQHVHRSKDAHRTAVKRLGAALTDQATEKARGVYDSVRPGTASASG